MPAFIDPTVRMTAKTARVLGCTPVPFDDKGNAMPLSPMRPTFIVRTIGEDGDPRGGVWMFWDFVSDEIARVVDNG